MALQICIELMKTGIRRLADQTLKLRNAIIAEWDAQPNIVAFSTSRAGGVSGAPYVSFNFATHVGDDEFLVAKNRSLLAERLPSKLRWQWLRQVHGAEVAIVSEPTSALTADALVTSNSSLVCCVQTADCLPIFLATNSGDEVALAHAGWRGLAAGILENTVKAMTAPASDLIAWLGPAIGPCHFEVGIEVKQCFLDTAISTDVEAALASCFYSVPQREKFMADMYAIARIKLHHLGVGQVSGGDRCTYCGKDQFFSFRREGTTGRMLNAIYIEA